MLMLPLDQLVHIQASLAFANLAATKEKRPRTRRGAGRRTSQPTIDNTTPRRVPIGTPSRPAPNTPFSHIQIIPKASAEQSSAKETSPQPMFRKSSLTHDAEAVYASSNSLATGRSTDSLANNTQGTTFAATARAAELRAARARKQLKENESQSRTDTSATPHEVMTFTKSRSKGGKTWKTLNLDDLPEVSDSDDQNNDYSTIQDQTNLLTAGHNSEHEDAPGTNPAGVRHYVSTLNPKEMVALPASQSGLSPDSKKLAHSVENYDASQWDPELPSKDKASRLPATQESIHIEGPNQRQRTTSITPALYPVPVLASSSDQIQKAAEYLRQKQEAQIRELEAELQSQAMHHQAMNQPRAFHAAVDLVSELHHSHSRSHLLAGSVVADSGDDPFAASPPPISPPSMNQFRPTANLPMGPPPVPYNHFGQAPRQFVPHQYPAVKGTTNNIASRPALERTFTGNSSTSQYHGYYPPGFHGRRPTTADMEQAPQTPYRKFSTEEKKGMLLQQLNAVVDESISSGALPKSGRTVLHDPFAYDQYQQPASAHTTVMGTSPETDLIATSDPLPWKDRPVDVVTTPAMANVEYLSIGNKQMTPIGMRPTRGGLARGLTMQNSAKMSIEEAEYWWSDDRRIDNVGKRQIEEFMENAKAGNRRDQMSEITNRLSHLAADAWSDGSQSISMPDAISGRAVGDHLLLPVLANLKAYLTPGDYFNKHGHVPEWCIDQGAGGQTSFFGEDWGAPPPRVGRDPRYQPVLHEGTRSVYENFGGRWGSDGYGRRYR
ncbi:hypothetical protein MMC26_006677 [Xylographa opegraphella]|nr:hypothetical protein [Xylographa opegraphella]